MKATKYLIVSIFAFSFFLIGCKSVKIIDHNSNFYGKWSANTSDTSWYIEINSQNEIFYQMVTGIETQKKTGIAKFRNNKLYIGLKSFKINKEPTKDSPDEFILNGVTFKKTQ